jgi:aryl-alcohol dehydrogenase-like predicted oxidoreductase
MIEKIIIGTAQFGLDYGITNKNGKINDDEIDKIFNFCLNNNINTFDTAQDYGNSEKILSINKKKYNNIKIITKSKFKNKNISYDENINTSILQFDKIDYFLLHSFDDYNSELINKLIEYKKKNKILKIGVSIYNVDEAKILLKDKNIDVIQLPINYIDNQWDDVEFMNLLNSRKDIEIHGRSIFLQGLLLNVPNKIPTNIDKSEFEKLNLIIINLCNKFNLTKLELCFAYINSCNWINKFLIGIDNYEHLINNYNIIKKNIKLNIEEIKEIKHICTGINQILLNPSNWLF